MISLVSLMFRG